MKRSLAVLLLCAVPLLCGAQTSDQPATSGKPAAPETQQRREGRGMRQGQGTAGTIAEIKPDGFTLKQMDGKTVAVKVTSETRFRKDRQDAKFADFKPGETVMVGGEPAGADAWTARFVASRTDGFVVGGGEGGMQALREGMGKQFIAGEVKAIDGTKLTIARPDGQAQTIEVDENTSFRKARESITLPDIKVGDHVFGRGAVNSAGVFVPTELNVGGGGGFGMGIAGPRRRLAPETKSSAPPPDLQQQPAPPPN
jgi:hypothetical protein